YWPDNAFDAFTMEAARSALERRRPRVLFIGLGETDEWGHGRRYDLYLDAANKSDRFLAETWRILQSVPQYKDKTALLVTTDHGQKVPGAEFVWIALLGPQTPASGERKNRTVTQSQVAATIAALVGENFNATSKEVAAPLPFFDADQ